jgi:hypothetical protein
MKPHHAIDTNYSPLISMSDPNAIAAELAAMAVVDVRDGGPVRHARERSDQARGLRDACLAVFPSAAAPLVPLLDAIARRWLARSQSPYVAEIAEIAALLNVPGIWLLNGSYQWGCTALAREEDGVPWLVRTLDWPFSGLGRYAEVAQMRGATGDYFSVTWPGYVGALTAMAPGRFAACINQAPLWRRTQHPWLRLFDQAMNGLRIWATIRYMPPDQLLRRVFEVCDSYGAARRMLETTPVARPVIYTLIGCENGECCVIERGEDSFLTREQETSAANDWIPSRPQWEGRIAAKDLLTQSFAGAAVKSRARREALAGWDGRLCDGRLDWVTPPVLNPYTRLAVAMNPSQAILRVTGYEMGDADLPQPVSQVLLPRRGHDEVIVSASASF